MFEERLRSHHDSQRFVDDLLGLDFPKEHSDISKLDDFLCSNQDSKPKVLYIHVPYCDRLCTFCNLNRELKKDSLSGYAQYIINELTTISQKKYIKNAVFSAVYFGGGTPTTFEPQDLEKILSTINTVLNLSNDCEFTFETTLHNLSDEKLQTLSRYGVNRFSIGIQTFSSEGRKLLNRMYAPEYAVDRIKNIKKSFKGNVCLDIIYSYPYQSTGEVENDALLCSNVDADSVSFYSLMIHNGSALYKSITEGKVIFERSVEQDKCNHNAFFRKMKENGYELLELSKLAKPGRDRYKYMKMRYANADTVPIGVGAGGSIGRYGIFNMAPGRKMIVTYHPVYDFFNRLLGYFQYGTYEEEFLRNYLNEDAYNAVCEKIETYEKEGFFIQSEKGIFKLTEDGIFWGNNIAAQIMKSAIENTVKTADIKNYSETGIL